MNGGNVWPRGANEIGGTLLMPLRTHVQNGRNGWRLIRCPSCGALCWERPGDKELIRKQQLRALCTMCALKGL